MSEHLKKYVDYIRNTGQAPLPVGAFDDDWDPIGPRIRAQLEAEGLIYEVRPDGGAFGDAAPGIYLRPDLAAEG